MEDERIPENVSNGKFHDTRPVGKKKKQDGRASGGTRAQIVGIKGLKAEKNGDVF